MRPVHRLLGSCSIALAALLAACGGGGGGTTADALAQAADERAEALSASRPASNLDVCNAENASTILAAVPAPEPPAPSGPTSSSLT